MKKIYIKPFAIYTDISQDVNILSVSQDFDRSQFTNNNHTVEDDMLLVIDEDDLEEDGFSWN